ncbi:MAG: carboxylate--amine ligase [Candidatus Riflebacteria bacterium]|nr:carboxylate--amine ligase [Candidatus Riflebacteria bacterium]
MNFLYLSPHFPPNFSLFCKRLSEQGVKVLGIGDSPQENLESELKNSLFDYYQVPNLENSEAVYRGCAYFIWKHGRIDRVESHIEHWLGLEAELREDFNIFGPKKAQTEAFRRKSSMKKIFRQINVPVADGVLFQDETQLREFVKKVGFPLVAKPDIGVGAWATYMIKNEKDIVDFLISHPPVDYFLEEFISGKLYTFDGITNSKGEMVLYTSHHSDTGVWELVNENLDLSYYSLREIPDQLFEYGKNIVAAFKLPEKFFHIEFFKLFKNDVFTVIEINCRPPGGFTTDMMNFTADVDVYRLWAEIVAHGRTHTRFDRKYHCAHVARKNGKDYVYSHEEILARYGDKIVVHTEVPEVFSAVMGNYTYLVRTPIESQIREMISEIQKVRG